jgi:gamma-glutamylcyclotransferase (GGCT)/AIG2-like uncharacterized protein YtfP
MAAKLFAYGTLRKSHAPREIAHAVSNLRPIGRGRMRGEIHDLGEYPAAILNRTTATIEGEVFEVPDEATLHALDEYEEFDPAKPSRSLFIRKRKRITLLGSGATPGRQIFCWVYEYNRPLPAHARRLT